ncbi:MAG TPA: hypothetical protein VL633_07810 [Bacteroidota bacterium]|jgi:hypothetical protein|nr:hypothetical protein [Bacteroidota bacterium]
MSSLLNITGAVVIGGLIMLSILGRAINLNQTSIEKTTTLTMQTNAVTAARILEYDFVKAGYKVPKGTAVTAADSVSITFTADLLDDGVVRTIQYSLGSTSESNVASTRNPRDRILHRSVSGQSSTDAILGLTNLLFTYYDSLGKKTTTLSQIRSIYVHMDFEASERVIKTTDTPSDTGYQGVHWEKTIFPRNL